MFFVLKASVNYDRIGQFRIFTRLIHFINHFVHRLDPFSSPEPWIDIRLWETLSRRTCAVGFL